MADQWVSAYVIRRANGSDTIAIGPEKVSDYPTPYPPCLCNDPALPPNTPYSPMMTKSMYNIILLVCIAAIGRGCKPPAGPDLALQPWTKVKIDYVVELSRNQSGVVVQRRTLESDSAQLLNRLQNSYDEESRTYMSTAFKSTTNQISITLKQDEAWVIYFKSSKEAVIHPSNSQDPVFYLRFGGQFYDEITSIIEEMTEDKVQLSYYVPVTIREE